MFVLLCLSRFRGKPGTNCAFKEDRRLRSSCGTLNGGQPFSANLHILSTCIVKLDREKNLT